MASKITWYVKQSGDFLPETNYYAGTYSPGGVVELEIQIWNNRWGTTNADTVFNAVLNMMFDTVEDSAILPLCKLSTDVQQLPLLIRGQSASAVLGKHLVGAKNDGDASNPANEDNFITLKLEVDLSDGRFKANDLKNLYFDLTSLDGQA